MIWAVFHVSCSSITVKSSEMLKTQMSEEVHSFTAKGTQADSWNRSSLAKEGQHSLRKLGPSVCLGKCKLIQGSVRSRKEGKSESISQGSVTSGGGSCKILQFQR